MEGSKEKGRKEEEKVGAKESFLFLFSLSRSRTGHSRFFLYTEMEMHHSQE